MIELSTIEEKAVRLVFEGRVTVTWETDGAASGIVDGDTGTYRCSFDPSGKQCTCPAGSNHRRCSHAIALELEVRRRAELLNFA